MNIKCKGRTVSSSFYKRKPNKNFEQKEVTGDLKLEVKEREIFFTRGNHGFRIKICQIKFKTQIVFNKTSKEESFIRYYKNFQSKRKEQKTQF